MRRPPCPQLWADQRKFSTWRRLWVTLAEAEQELGLPITDEQIAELRSQVDNIDFAAAAAYERRLRHDVMAHVHAYGDVCPQARPIIHLGATSCYVTDNTDLLLIREALTLVRQRLVTVVERLADFADRYRDLACLAWTHLQPAQPTTVGRRACLWAYDLLLDLAEVEHRIESLAARSTKGTTGTQASFLELFAGDHGKVRALERRVAEKMGFDQHLCRHRADLPPQGRQPGAGHPVGHRPERSQSGHRSEDSGPPQRDGRTVRDRTDRLVRHGLQTQSDAL